MSLLKNFYKNPEFEAGCDEAGRGCLAGPVFAAAVVLPQDFYHPLLNDSKQISARNRQILRTYIEENAIDFGVCHLDPDIIDQINILNASIMAMHLALDKLKNPPAHIIVDGNRFKPYCNITHDCIIKGDAKYSAIAAASVLAKTYRDEYMLAISEKYPEYGWKSNAGYPTAEHRNAIRNHGITPYHRKSFRLLPEQIVQGTLFQ